ncbi:hypothetical protein ACOI1C_09760 [Bacillus sp. DJP31]
MTKDEKASNQSYESDGIMGKDRNEVKQGEEKEKDFFNMTPESE